MPLLKRAKRVEVLIVANERDKQDEIEGADMGAHLARHGLNVEIKRSTIGDIDVADVILSHAADTETNFIVMGGYGHSRLRNRPRRRDPDYFALDDRAGSDVALSDCRQDG